MRSHFLFLLAFAASPLLNFPAAAQTPAPNLCFLSALPPMSWPARTYCTNGTGASRLVGAVSDDTAIVVADYDRRVLVVGSNSKRTVDGAESYGVHGYSVIDMSSPASPVRQVDIDYNANDKFISQTYLLDVPGQGLMLAVELGDSPTKEGRRPADALTAARLGTGDPATLETLPFSMLTYVRASGFVGGGSGDSYSLPIPHLRGDPLSVLSSDGRPHQTSIPRPPYIKGEQYEVFDLDANNDAIAAITNQWSKATARNAVDIFDKKSGAWYRATAPFSIYRARAFGPWIAAIETEPRAEPLPQLSPSQLDGPALTRLRVSPGKQERQAIHLTNKLTLADVFDGEGYSTEYYSGDLFILNGRTRQQFTIHTGQGDSEVVLVTDDAVYYRVNDALFRASFVNGKLADGVQIAKGTEVAMCHWAFLSPAPAQPR